MSNFDDDEDEEVDPILRVLGPALAGRARTNEIGIFSSIETQNFILDSLMKELSSKNHMKDDEEALQSLKRVFDETKISKARAHKLDRLISERIKSSVGGNQNNSGSSTTSLPQKSLVSKELRDAKPNTINSDPEITSDEVARQAPAQSQIVKIKDETAPVAAKVAEKRSFQEKQLSEESRMEPPDIELTVLPAAEKYQMAPKLKSMKATVRVRARPNISADQIGLVTHETSYIIVDGLTRDWLRLQWRDDNDESQIGWVMRSSPQQEPLFELVETTNDPPAQATIKHSQKTGSNKSLEPSNQGQMVTISAEEFYKLVDRVELLERQLNALRDLLRSA